MSEKVAVPYAGFPKKETEFPSTSGSDPIAFLKADAALRRSQRVQVQEARQAARIAYKRGLANGKK